MLAGVLYPHLGTVNVVLGEKESVFIVRPPQLTLWQELIMYKPLQGL